MVRSLYSSQRVKYIQTVTWLGTGQKKKQEHDGYQEWGEARQL